MRTSTHAGLLKNLERLINMNIKWPEVELHKHNSLSCYTGAEDEGCVLCIKNKTIYACKKAVEEAQAESEIEGNRLSEICSETLDRLTSSQPVGDLYLLGLAWTIKSMGERERNLYGET